MNEKQIQIVSSLKTHLLLQGILESFLLVILILAVVNIVKKLTGGAKLSNRDILLFVLCMLVIPLASIPVLSETFISVMRPFFKEGNIFHFPLSIKLDIVYNLACRNVWIYGPILVLIVPFLSAVFWALFTQYTRSRFAIVIAILVILTSFPPAAIAINGIIAKAQEINLLLSYYR